MAAFGPSALAEKPSMIETQNVHELALPPLIDVEKLRFPVIRKVLPNGLTVLIHVDHSVPTISYHTWFRVGSKYEETGFTGIAHLFEHMMFKGAKRYTASQFENLMQANGITDNAFTTYDYTGYYEDLPSSKLRLVMDIESDRMENLALTPENLKSEREVVKEERRWRVDNSIPGSMNETLWSTAFKVSPYHWPVVGWMTDIDNITLEKCKQFFHTYYSVSNAVIAIVGDVEPKEALNLVEEFYGKLPKVDIPKRNLPEEPPQEQAREVTIQRVAQSAHDEIAWHIGKQGEPDSYVMDLISNILTEGDSSRLYKKLVYQDQKTLDVGGASVTPQDPGLFEISLELKPGVKPEAELPHLYSEVERLSKEKVPHEELEKAKNQMMYHWVQGMRRIHDKAYGLILNEIVTGSYANLFDDLDRYQKITADDILRVAQKYLTKDNRTIVELLPQAPEKPGKHDEKQVKKSGEG